MNNSVFGKTMENLRKRVNIELVTNEKRLNKLSAKPTYVSNKVFNENLVAVHTKKEKLLLKVSIRPTGFLLFWYLYNV